jgi:hypothetical protein
MSAHPKEPVPSGAHERYEYALRTHRMALDMFEMIVPWRWKQWFATRREVLRRIAALKEARAA